MEPSFLSNFSKGLSPGRSLRMLNRIVVALGVGWTSRTTSSNIPAPTV